MKRKVCTSHLLLLVLSALLLTGCSVTRFIPEGDYLLDDVSIRSTDKTYTPSGVSGYVRQHPNSKWFSVIKVPMSPYLLSGRDSTKRINRFLRRIGEKPVIYDSLLAERTRTDMEKVVRNKGYLNAEVALNTRTRSRRRIRISYDITPHDRYHVDSIHIHVADSLVDSVLAVAHTNSLLHPGMPFDMNVLDSERGRINKALRNHGYFLFNKNFVRYEADTTLADHGVNLDLFIEPFTGGKQHPRYSLSDVSYQFDERSGSMIRPKVLYERTAIMPGGYYSENDVQRTYSNLSQLGAVLSTNINMQVDEVDSTRLNTMITVVSNKPHGLNAELEGTNSAGDLGAALSLSYQNRNLFHGSERLSAKVRGAFEAIKGLEGYDDQNYIEYSAELSLAFPDFKMPFLSESFRRNTRTTSEISLQYDSQDRPEFHRRVVTGAWRYRWYRDSKMQHRIDLLDLNYVFMPWISETFKRDYLDDPSSRNAILRYNYENLFIMKWGYMLQYNSQPLTGASGNYGSNAYSIRFAVESSGNFLYGITNALGSAKNKEGQYTLLNIAYAEYVKGDFDFAKSFRFDQRNSLAVHIGLGVAYPYGNSTILPYEKRYFSGGANSVRGWSVRGLGPGSYMGTDGRIDFINQTGDIKLDMNAEYRSHVFWKVDGALFVDAGNIWTMRNYEDQPGGQFRLNTFWRQIAVAYGLGLRLNFDYFILRLDGGMKAIHPAYTGAKHYPIIHPNFKRDFSIHFAVGLPF